MYWWVRKIYQKLKKRKGFPLIRQHISLPFKGSGILTNAKTNNTFFHKAHALEFTESNERITIDRMHKWRPKIYSFVYLLMRLTSLALKRHFCYILFMKTRLVRLISTQTKEYFFWPLFMHSVYRQEKVDLFYRYGHHFEFHWHK